MTRTSLRYLLIASLWLGLFGGTSILTMGQDSTDNRRTTSPLRSDVERWARELEHSNPTRRALAAKKLAELSEAASAHTESLIRCLSDPDIDVRVNAAYAMSRVPHDKIVALESLVPLLQDSNEHVRYSAEWSIAHLVRHLPELSSETHKSRVIAVCEQSLNTWKKFDPQPRHRIAVEVVRNQLLGQVPMTVPPNLPTDASTSLTDAGKGLNIEQFTRSLYQANDYLGRLRLIHRIADSKTYPDLMRQTVLEVEATEFNSILLDHALTLWGDLGQKNLEQIIARWPTSRFMKDHEVRLISKLVPTNGAIQNKLAKWANMEGADLALRDAAIQALAHTRHQPQSALPVLVSLLQSNVPQIRISAIDALGAMGSSASQTESLLLPLLNAHEEVDLQFSVLDALAQIAPQSTRFGERLSEMLHRLDAHDDDVLIPVIRAYGAHQPCHEQGIPRLIELLHAESADLRCDATEALCQLGIASQPAAGALIERILDPQEAIRIKNRAAKTFAQWEPEWSLQLVNAHRHDDANQKEAVLRALAIIGPKAILTEDFCFYCLHDASLPTSIRTAAANAVGGLGPAVAGRVKEVLAHIDDSELEEVRAAALIAAARIAPTLAVDYAQLNLQDRSLLVRASSALSLHLAGESRIAFDTLLTLLDGSETDPIIESTLAEFGPTIKDWCLEVATNSRANAESRLACMRLACEAEFPIWEKLLPLVQDDELGESFTDVLASAWHVSVHDAGAHETRAMEILLQFLEDERLTTTSHARLASLLQPAGLGSGEEDEQWSGASLSTPTAVNTFMAKSRSMESQDMPMLETREEAPERIASEFKPDDAVAAISVAEAASQATNPKEVLVLYGTNRMRDTENRSMREVVLTILIATGGSVCVLFCCLIGFARSGHRFLAIISLAAIALFGPLGLFAASQVAKRQWSAPVSYTGELQQSIEYGTCTVTIPPIHKKGELEGVQLFTMDVQPNPEKHIVLKDVHPLTCDSFFTTMHDIQKKKGKNILVFIHGYNVSFEDAARRTAQIAFDLEFPGAPVFYSWPSQANWYQYGKDKENIRLSIAQIEKFLLDLSERSGAETINLVAHSMGNVGLTEALKAIELAGKPARFQQVVLAAPDIDAEVFKSEIAPFIVGRANRMTLYTSQTDLALIASRYFNDGPRVGDSGEMVPLFDGIETIDATAVDSSLLGHSYYGSNVSVLTDLGRLLRNQSTVERAYLRPIGMGVSKYWAFDPVLMSSMQEAEVTR